MRGCPKSGFSPRAARHSQRIAFRPGRTLTGEQRGTVTDPDLVELQGYDEQQTRLSWNKREEHTDIHFFCKELDLGIGCVTRVDDCAFVQWLKTGRAHVGGRRTSCHVWGKTYEV